jgi:hypothetical protein
MGMTAYGAGGTGAQQAVAWKLIMCMALIAVEQRCNAGVKR